MKKHIRLLTVMVILGVALSFVTARTLLASQKLNTLIVVVDGKEQGNMWLAHTYPNDQFDQGVPVKLIFEKDTVLAPKQVISVTGVLDGWRTSARAAVKVQSFDADIPQQYPNVIDLPGDTPQLPIPATSEDKLSIVVTFEEQLGPNRWSTTITGTNESLVVVLAFSDLEKEIHEKRWKGASLKGATLKLVGDKQPKDEMNRPVIVISRDSHMRPLNTP